MYINERSRDYILEKIADRRLVLSCSIMHFEETEKNDVKISSYY